MEPINFAICGCGHIAARHARAAIKHGTLTAVCDSDISKAKQLASQFNCIAYSNLSEMIAKEKIDVVSICTPNYLHSTQSIECLQKGKHVICEKPMAITVKDAEDMICASKKNGRELFIVKQLRYYPHLLYLQQLFNTGQLGKIFSFHINCFWNRPDEYYKEWKGTKQKDGGTLYTQFSHYIDLILWLFGEVEDVQFISGNFAHEKIDFEDTGIVNFVVKNGAIGSLNYTVNAYQQNFENSITIFARYGTIKLSGTKLDKFDYFNVKGIDDTPLIAQINTHKDQSHFKVYEDVVTALAGKANTALKAEDSITSIRLIEKIYKR